MVSKRKRGGGVDKSSKVKFNPTMVLHGEGGLKNHNKENNKDDNMQKYTIF